MTKAHNNANVLCLAARVSSLELMQNMIQSWLDTDFEEGRHIQRIGKFDQLGS
jgi:ribose 5-phosphate isomerase B